MLLLTNCNRINLTDQEAKGLIIKTLNLPQKFNTKVSRNDMRTLISLERAGLIYKKGGFFSGYMVYATDKGKPYLIGEETEHMYGKNVLKFKSFEIDFNQITGIAINKEQQTATVRFSLKAINITPIGRATERNIDDFRNGELVFKKFDNGWQLESDQNKSSIDIVKKIWWDQE